MVWKLRLWLMTCLLSLKHSYVFPIRSAVHNRAGSPSSSISTAKATHILPTSFPCASASVQKLRNCWVPVSRSTWFVFTILFTTEYSSRHRRSRYKTNSNARSVDADEWRSEEHTSELQSRVDI